MTAIANCFSKRDKRTIFKGFKVGSHTLGTLFLGQNRLQIFCGIWIGKGKISDCHGNIAIALRCTHVIAVGNSTKRINDFGQHGGFRLKRFFVQNILQSPNREGEFLHLVADAFSGVWNRSTHIKRNPKCHRSNFVKSLLCGGHRNDIFILIARIRRDFKANNFVNHFLEFANIQNVVGKPIAPAICPRGVFLQHKAHNKCRQITGHKTIRCRLQNVIDLLDRYTATTVLEAIVYNFINTQLDFGNQEMRLGKPVFGNLPCAVKSDFQLCGGTAGQEGTSCFLIECALNTLLQAARCIHIGNDIVRALKAGHELFLVDFCKKAVQSVQRSSTFPIRLICGVNHKLTACNAGFPFLQRIFCIVGILSN